MPVGRMLKSTLGEVADMLMMVGLLWPYPLLLSLQGLVPAQGLAGLLTSGAAVLLGLGIVWRFTSCVEKWLGYDTWSEPRAYMWAPWLWALPLVALQAAAHGLAILLGLPAGE
jgi:hypothetical protein